MAKSDRFLLLIVSGIILLVIASLIVSLRRPEVAYKTGNSPTDVVHNYLLALSREDYDRALAALDPAIKSLPEDAMSLQADIRYNSWFFRVDQDHSLEILSQEIQGQKAQVVVQELQFYRNGPFGGSQTTTKFTVFLTLVEDSWKISGSEAYFADCWRSDSGCGGK